jgi:hypothetical protein
MNVIGFKREQVRKATGQGISIKASAPYNRLLQRVAGIGLHLVLEPEEQAVFDNRLRASACCCVAAS